STTPSSQTRLLSGASLLSLLSQHVEPDPSYTRHRILFLDRPWLSTALTLPDLVHLNSLFPAIPSVTPFFEAALEACRPSLINPRHWPVPPPITSDEEN